VNAWPRSRPGRPYLAGSPLLIAHRGGAGLAPENTLEAFLSAVRDWGADMLEMDVRSSRDGVVMVHHDATVDRTTDGQGNLADKTFQELRELDAGFNFRDLDGRETFRGVGVRIPTIEEVLEALPHTPLNVEAKDSRSAVPLVEIIRRHGAHQRVLVAAEWERNRRRVTGYKGPWGASRRQITAFLLLTATPLSPLYTPACDVLQVPEVHRGIRILTARFLREAHRRNIPVHVWTVDDPDDMRRLLSMGVDGIQTDRPDLLAPILTEMCSRPPAPRLVGSLRQKEGGA
jgi:glycerophosphoryl diester phosphodiesterase